MSQLPRICVVYKSPIVISPFTLAVKWISTSISSSMLILRLFFFSSLATYSRSVPLYLTDQAFVRTVLPLLLRPPATSFSAESAVFATALSAGVPPVASPLVTVSMRTSSLQLSTYTVSVALSRTFDMLIMLPGDVR